MLLCANTTKVSFVFDLTPYMSLNKFLQIKRYSLIECIKTTLLTHT
jgi:hypothetical protein